MNTTTTKELTCVRCPMGCQIRVVLEDGEVISVTGNTCPRGAEYAENEVTHPMRTVTSTIRVDGGKDPVVSVKTSADIPKDMIFDIMRKINACRVTAPVAIGDVIIPDICNTGASLLATGNVEKKTRY